MNDKRENGEGCLKEEERQALEDVRLQRRIDENSTRIGNDFSLIVSVQQTGISAKGRLRVMDPAFTTIKGHKYFGKCKL